MKIAAAQTKPFRGDISRNIKQHTSIINEAVDQNADFIFFPELSLTGYEPELAQELALKPTDKRLEIFQTLSNKSNIVICVGAPIKYNSDIRIGSIIFKPGTGTQTYEKQFLHKDELIYFSMGLNENSIIYEKSSVALAICYEISIDEHIESAIANGAKIYLASVAKTEPGIESAANRLSSISMNYSIPVLMANCCGPSGDGVCWGNSSIWYNTGKLMAKLDNENPGILVYDTETNKSSLRQFTIDQTL